MNKPEIHEDVERILFTKEQLEEICRKLGEQITHDYEGKKLYVISILKGAFVFLADLTRYINKDIEIDFMAVSTYKDKTESSGRPQIRLDLSHEIRGKDVLIVEDILDSGVTLDHIIKMLMVRNPNSIKICTLLDKESRRKAEVKNSIKADYYGSKIENEFVVGYGLDYAEKYRNLPYIGILKRSVYENRVKNGKD